MKQSVYIINSANPKDLALELEKINDEYKFVILEAQTTKELFFEIDENINNDRILQELETNKRKEAENMKYAEWKNFIFQKTFEPNKLTDDETKELCYEYYEKFIMANIHIINKPDYPKVEIIEDLTYWPISKCTDRFYKKVQKHYINAINQEINVGECLKSMPFIDPLYISSAYGSLINRNQTIGGIVQYGRENYKIYKINYEGHKLSKPYQEFWNWYQKSLDVIAIYYNDRDNTCYVIKKPDEWAIENDNTQMYYRYGDKEKYYFQRTEIPKWLYTTHAEELTPKDLLCCENADEKAFLISKIGIDKFVEYGKIIDSYENYPENEMWAKSEYKLIDMINILPKERMPRNYKQAPFLYMKNQTTGIYHLEGVNPGCKTLYDALEMRYSGLNLPEYEIKAIK